MGLHFRHLQQKYIIHLRKRRARVGRDASQERSYWVGRFGNCPPNFWPLMLSHATFFHSLFSTQF